MIDGVFPTELDAGQNFSGSYMFTKHQDWVGLLGSEVPHHFLLLMGEIRKVTCSRSRKRSLRKDSYCCGANSM